MTEAEVGAHGNPSGLKCVQQHAGDEVFGTQLREFAAEGHQDELLDPQRFQQGKFFAGKVQPQACLAEQHLSWVGPEAHHRGNGLLWAALDGLADHTAMAGVETIKTAEGQSRRPASVLW